MFEGFTIAAAETDKVALNQQGGEEPLPLPHAAIVAGRSFPPFCCHADGIR